MCVSVCAKIYVRFSQTNSKWTTFWMFTYWKAIIWYNFAGNNKAHINKENAIQAAVRIGNWAYNIFFSLWFEPNLHI